jgi:hypothetical protein
LSTPAIVDITGSDSDGEDPTGRVSEIAVLNSGRHGAFEAQDHLELEGESVARYKQDIKLAASCGGFGNLVGGGAATAPARTKSLMQAKMGLVSGLAKGHPDFKNVPGKVETFRTNMNDMKKAKKITSMLHGKAVYNKTRFAGMARLSSGNMKRLQPYVTFEDGFSGAPGYEIETSYFGLLGGSWSPQEFKCLEYYDWDISPPRSASSSK